MPNEDLRLVDRLCFWVAASAAVILMVGLFILRGDGFSVVAFLLTMLLFPMILAGLLSGRALLFFLTGRSPDLHLWGAMWLRGAPALVVPLLLFMLIILLRETESGFEANLFRVHSSSRSNWSHNTTHKRGALTIFDGSRVDLSSRQSTATEFSLDGPDTAFHRAVAAELERIELPAGTSVARVELDSNEPFSWVPFYKRADLSFEATITLQITRGNYQNLRWTATLEVEQDVTATGFLSSRDFVRELGEEVGAKLLSLILAELPKLEAKLSA